MHINKSIMFYKVLLNRELLLYNKSGDLMNIYDVLDKLNIDYTEITHKALFTVDDAREILNKIDGQGCKNLFLTNKKDNFYLVVMLEDKRANIKELELILQEKHLTFAHEEDLYKILKLKKGSVTPLGIINDENNKVKLLIDKDLVNKKLLFHPNVNTKTISIEYKDLIKFIEYAQHSYILY